MVRRASRKHIATPKLMRHRSIPLKQGISRSGTSHSARWSSEIDDNWSLRQTTSPALSRTHLLDGCAQRRNGSPAPRRGDGREPEYQSSALRTLDGVLGEGGYHQVETQGDLGHRPVVH